MVAVKKAYGQAGVVTLLTLLPLIGTTATAGTDLLTANVDTKYGRLTIENVRIISRGPSCELRANVSNLAPVAWSGLAFEIRVDGRDDKGDAVTITGTAEADRLSRDAAGFVSGRCTHRAIGDFGNGVNPQNFEALRVRASSCPVRPTRQMPLRSTSRKSRERQVRSEPQKSLPHEPPLSPNSRY